MKKSLFVMFLFSASVLFAQKAPNYFLNKNKSTQGLLLPNKSKYSLNLDFLKLEHSKKKITSLSKLLYKSSNKRLITIDNMPIFEPKGKIFLKIYEADEDIDYKLRIFDLEKSKYFLRSVG